jgi:glyoxylase-like metal-dependent hydrolase (beta-lactamase superfamily II)
MDPEGRPVSDQSVSGAPEGRGADRTTATGPPGDTETYQAAPGITGVDTRMAGRTRLVSGYLLSGGEPALVETGPATSVEAVMAGLTSLGLGPDDLAHIAVTHIHLDHAGGVGTLARHFPRATVWVHERGAPHLADPERLLRSAGRLYGESRLLDLFGPMEPVPAERLHAVDDGDRIPLGGRSLEVLYTPGHASHHVSLVDSSSGALFTGDALGIHLPDARVLRPATPPPDIDVELGVQSIERIRKRAETVLLFSHFGPVREVGELCAIAADRLRKWARIVREALDETEDIDRIAELLEHGTRSEFDEALARGETVDRERLELLSTMKMNAQGLVRYWKKRREAADGPRS